MFSQPTPRRDFLLIVCASISWGTVGLANHIISASGTSNALSLSFLRLAIATPLFVFASWLRLGRGFLRIKPRDCGVMLLMGSLIALSQACYVASLASAGVGISTLIAICVAPIIIALCSTFVTREPLTPLTLLSLVAALSGTALLVSTRLQTAVSLLGILLALLSACGYAGFILCGRLLTQSYHPLQISTVAFGTGALVLLVCAASTKLVLAYPVGSWLILLYLGCIPTALGYGIFQLGIRSLSATVASIVTMCEPLTAAILAWIFLQEQPGPVGVLGAGFLLGAMLLILLAPKRYFEKGQAREGLTGERGASGR